MDASERPSAKTAIRTEVARWVVIFAGVVSLALMFRAGSRNRSVLLIALFTGWVSSPFLALLWADVTARRRAIAARGALDALLLGMSVATLAIYAGWVPLPAGVKNAAPYLVVPGLSWLLIAVVVPLVLRRAPRT
jgi:hypothetical protein